jgi:AcrR family transcriptional regulator
MSSNTGMNKVAQRIPPAASEAGRVYGGESLASRSARRREQFLDAGLEIFGTSGYRQATVRQLCKQAELTDRYFYESFDTLEDLLIAVYEREFDQLAEALASTLSKRLDTAPKVAPAKALLNSSLREGMTDIVQALDTVFNMATDPRVARVCWLEVLGVSPRVDAVYIGRVDLFATLTLQVARTHLPGWQPDPTEARVLGVAVVGAISQTITHWLLTGRQASKKAMVQATGRVFEGLFTLIEARTAEAGQAARKAASNAARKATPRATPVRKKST